VAAVDAYLGATQGSETLGMEYAGAHVIEDLLRGRPVVLRAVSYGTDCYPRKELLTEITLADLNQALMSNPRNAYQRYNAAANSGERTLHTYMGKLLPGCGNVTFSGAGELSPLANDPDYETVGIGTRIFLGGAVGYVTGAGTQHNPQAQFATLMVQGDLKEMSPDYLRAAVFHGYGSSLYVGIGIPIPVLRIACKTAIRDRRSKPRWWTNSRAAGRNWAAAITAVEIGSAGSAATSCSPWSPPQIPAGGPGLTMDRAGRFHLSEPVAPIPGKRFPRNRRRRAADLFIAAGRPEPPAPARWLGMPGFSLRQCLASPAGVFRRDDVAGDGGRLEMHGLRPLRPCLPGRGDRRRRPWPIDWFKKGCASRKPSPP
jgi:hypothetical protein